MAPSPSLYREAVLGRGHDRWRAGVTVLEASLGVQATRSRDTESRDLPTDAVVIARVLDGDIEAFGILVDRYAETLTAYAGQMMGNVDEAADIVQDSLVRAYKSLRRCRDRSNFKGWLFRIVSNQCKTRLGRRQRRRTEPFAGEVVRLPAPDDPVADLEAAEDRRRLQSALQELPVDQREALVLYYMDGLSVKEVADLLSVSPSALKMRLLRGRAALRDHLEGVR